MLHFAKLEGTGNDFILINDQDAKFPSGDLALVRRLCDRHFGVGSDGLILVQAPKEVGTDFHMEFFNPDGSKSFCGNGSRCAYVFWCRIEGCTEPARFTAIDGVHAAEWQNGLVRIAMRDVTSVERIDERTDRIHTGSPHLVVWVDDPERIDLMAEARSIRYSPLYEKEGINVNFIRWHEGHLEMRTYERGVEAETLSCGTGVTAAALSAMQRGMVQASCEVFTRGGRLRVEAGSPTQGLFTGVHLSGPVGEVFTGTIHL
ncbi:MAG: diaminopimelate epimerase [Flavobacteriales bacterium]|nr:diaminopimelate epimerase [Flavobacteriales bacterium]